MKSVTISAPDAIFDQTIEALCSTGGYQSGDQLEFAKEQLIAMLGDKLRLYAQKQIRDTAQQQIQANIEQANAAIADNRDSIVIDISTQ